MTLLCASDVAVHAAQHCVWAMPPFLLQCISKNEKGEAVFNACCGDSGRVPWAASDDVPLSLRDVLIVGGDGRWDVCQPPAVAAAVVEAEAREEVLSALVAATSAGLAAELFAAQRAGGEGTAASAALRDALTSAAAEDANRDAAVAALEAALVEPCRRALSSVGAMRALAPPPDLPGTRHERSDAAWCMAEYADTTRPLWAKEARLLGG